MKKTKVKIPAKVNLTLDVLEKEENYHNIRSLVASIDVYDKIKIKKRKDNKITLKVKGIDCKCAETENNAYKAVKLFADRYSTCGVDIIIKKRIPLASGLGGSSADIAGALKAMQKMFGTSLDIVSLANELGSDSVYMLHGGYSVIYERGNSIIPIRSKVKIPAIVLLDDKTISAKEGYAGFDKEKKQYDSVTFDAVAKLVNIKEDFFNMLKNDLQPYAESVMPELSNKISNLKTYGAETALLTGSGSAVYGLFLSRRARNIAYKALKNKYFGHIIKCHTF